MNKIIIIVSAVILFFSCKENSNRDPVIITPINSINVFGDSTYFSSIFSIETGANSYYFSDYTNSRIVKTNKNLNYLLSLGSHGEGPNEFNGTAEFLLIDSNLYAFDAGNLRMNIYNNDKWIRAIKVPTYGPFMERFYVNEHDSLIAYARLGGSTNIIKMDLNGQLIEIDRMQYNSYWNKQRKVKSAAHIIETSNNRILLIPLDEPTIFVYNTNWVLVNKIMLDDIFILNDPISNLQSVYHTLAHNTTSIIFYDAYMDEGDNLYLLTYCINSKKEKEFNILMKFSTSSDSITYDHSYKLTSENNGDWYNAIAVSNDTLVAFEYSTSEIQLFSLIEE